MTLTPEDLAKIEARVDAATEGPWHWSERHKRILEALVSEKTEVCNFGTDYDYYPTEGAPPQEYDKVFIAHAREDIPALIAALRETWAENERLSKCIETINTTWRGQP